MKLSIVSTLYNSAEYIEEFIERSKKVAQEIADFDYEIILVDDGSPDNSLQIAIELTHTHKSLKVIELSRKFWSSPSNDCGISRVKG